MEHRIFLKEDGKLSSSSFVLLVHDPRGHGLQIHDQGCFIPSKVEWDGIKMLVDEFYDTTPDHIIQRHNDHLSNRECAGHFLGEAHK